MMYHIISPHSITTYYHILLNMQEDGTIIPPQPQHKMADSNGGDKGMIF